ncbi:MAG: acetate/propionate family kinase [Pseudomonadota bacterium]
MILVLNTGSSSIKFSLFDATLAEALSGIAEEIGGAARLTVAGVTQDQPLPDHAAALQAIFAALEACGIALATLSAVAHRVVHGGAHFSAPCRITADSMAAIEAAAPLAPLHSPPMLAAIRAVTAIAPHLAQTASFDTAFHATVPDVAARYALPPEAEALGLRRYGFHGNSFASLVQTLPQLSGAPLATRLLALHLGNGASLCAIRDGQSAATTMGYSPLSGLTMGTRTGDIDGNAVLRLAEAHGIDGAEALLNRKSGLKGLGGHSDMRALLADDTPQARFAIAHFRYWVIRHAGSMIAAMGGLDAVAFTGGIGEHDPDSRAAICDGLRWLGVSIDPEANASGGPALHAADSDIPIWIVPAEEERQIAQDALGVLGTV